MEIIQILKALGLVITLVVLLLGVINVFYRLQQQEHMDPSFKQIAKYLLVSALVSDMMLLFNLLLSAASGGWPLGFVTCEVWGYASTTMLAFTAWLVTTAVAERYFAILSPSEVSSTFSYRNTRIISVGLFLLIMMAATGPFYGFGEYTYLREDVANTLNISDTQLTAEISMADYYNYRQNQLPVQDMGICTADITTPNHYSSIWTGFYVSILFILPYSVSLAGLCTIYIRGFGFYSFASKRASDLDVSLTNITSSICMMTCAINLIYFVTILSTDEGSVFSPSIVFWVTYIISLKTLPLLLTMRLGPNMCNCYCTCCAICLKKIFRTGDEMSYELNDLEMTQSLTGKRKLSKVVI